VGVPKQKTAAIGAAIVVLIAIVVYCAYRQVNRAPLSQREIATRVLAEYIRKTAKPKGVLIVSNPYARDPGRPSEVYAFQKASEAGLRKGFGPEIDVKVGFPKLKPEAIRDVSSVFVDPNSTTPLSYLVAEDAYDQLMREHPECDVFVSLIGLPGNTATSPVWLRNGPPRFGFLLPDFKIMGDPNAIRQVFKTGKIIAAVIPKPGVSLPDRVAGVDYKAEFDRRFILVTGENIDESLPKLLR
jgi:hypothetical protein